MKVNMTEKASRTLAYFDAETGDYIVRRAGTNLARLSIQDVENAEIINRWALEGMFRALLAGHDYDDICDGSALPDRNPPVSKSGTEHGRVTKLQQAVANVRAHHLRGQVDGIVAAREIALKQVLKLSPEALAIASKAHAVRVELEKLTQVENDVDLNALFSNEGIAEAA
jgi:hypothetical protein